MIVVKLMGGLGNQMFEYAAGRALSINRSVPMYIDLNWFKNKSVDTLRPYELGNLKTIQESFDIQNCELLPDTTTSRLKILISGGDKSFVKYTESKFNYNPAVLKLPGKSYLDGYFQSEKYFLFIRDVLLSEFVPSYSLNSAAKKDLELIKSTSESVSLHVRRGDYVANKNAAQFHGLTGIDYYNAALKEVAKDSDDKLTVFIFSDDLDWCKKNLKFKYPIHFIGSAQNSFDDMWLMSHCRNNIIANSSYSWWGAWLNKNEKKKVVGPRLWFADKGMDYSDVLPKEWIKL